MKGNIVIKDKIIHIDNRDKSSIYQSIIGTIDFTKNPPEYIPKSLADEIFKEEENESAT